MTLGKLDMRRLLLPIHRCVLLTALLSLALTAGAEDESDPRHFYLGFAVQKLGSLNHDDLYKGLELRKRDEHTAMVYGGYQAGSWLSLEVTMRDLGGYRANGVSQEFAAFTMDSLLHTPGWHGLSAFGAAGLAVVSSDIRLPDTRRDSSDAGLHLGVGLQWRIPGAPMTLRFSASRIIAEAEVYRGVLVDGQARAESNDYRLRFRTAQLGIHYRF